MPGTLLAKVQHLNTQRVAIEHGIFEEEIEHHDGSNIELEEVERHANDGYAVNQNKDDLVADVIVHFESMPLIEAANV